MFQIIAIALLLIISTGLVAKAENGSANEPIASAHTRTSESFDVLLEKLHQHPEIQAYADKAEAAGHAANGELGLPDPMLFFEEKDLPISSGTSQGEEQQMVGFSQEIPAFGTRGARSDKMAAESGKNKLLGDYAFAAMKARLITALADLKKIKTLEGIAQEQQSLVRGTSGSIKGRIAANQATLSEDTITQSEGVDVAIKIANLAEERHEVEAMLVNMLGEAATIDPPAFTPNPWNNDADRTYPVVLARADIEMAKADTDLREAEYGPKLALETGVTRMHNGDDAATVRLGLSVPLWAVASQAPKLDSAKASLSAAERQQDSVRRETIQKLEHLQAQIDASSKRGRLLKQKEILLQKTVGAVTREYEGGKATLAMILKAKRDVLDVKAERAMEEAKNTSLIADFNRYFIKGE